MMLRDLLGVPGPLGLELGLEFGPEPGPLGLDGLEMIGLELTLQIQQLAQPGLSTRISDRADSSSSRAWWCCSSSRLLSSPCACSALTRVR